jgi:hypothetical protein
VRGKSVFFKLGLLICICISGLSACVTSVPLEEYTLARSAYEAAREAESARYAPGLWYKADEAYKKGQKFYQERDYQAATEMFNQAKTLSERAENAARIARMQTGGAPP